MLGYRFDLCGAGLEALASGGLFWADEGTLILSDLHLGRSDRIARRGGALLPPYEVTDTLRRLEADLAVTQPRQVICLGDSFDDPAAADLAGEHRRWLARLMAGRRWVWIEGNHDPGPLGPGGEHGRDLRLGPLTFRHIALGGEGTRGEVSGHFHPKLRLAGQTRRAFLCDGARLVLPAYGTYTGGLDARDPALRPLFGRQALAILTGAPAVAVPF